jgi:protein SCO1
VEASVITIVTLGPRSHARMKPDIEAIRRGIGFVDPNPEVDRDKSQHIGNIRYGNEPLVLWGACPGMSHASWLFKEISSVIRPENRST